MTNSYYTKAASLDEGTTAQGSEVEGEFDSIQTGFDLVETDTNRSIKIPSGETVDLTENAGSRANKVVAADANGDVVWASIGDLSAVIDVVVSSVANNDVLAWDNSDSRWENRTLATLLGATTSGYVLTDNGSGTAPTFQARDIPKGGTVKMVFINTSAPAGWTFDSTNNDKVLTVTSTAAEGGDTGGGWTITGVTVDSHTLTTSEIPSHSHSLTGAQNLLSAVGGSLALPTAGSAVAANVDINSTGNAGSGNGHNHGLTADGTWRPAYVKTIVCSHD